LINTVMNGLMLAIYWIGAYLIDAADLKDKLTLFSNMVVFSSYSVQVIMSFLLMSMVFVLLPRADVSATRILEVLDTDPMVTDGAEVGSTGVAGAVTAATAATTSKGTVEFKNVSFAYPDSREAMLEGITFSAQPGQTVAFIGSTGSGKSSLVNLVPRFYDATEGQVLVDGVDVRNYTLKALRDKIGYVPQQSVLFKGTVASNIRYGDRPQDSADVELVDTSSIQGRRREAELMKHANDVQDLGDEQQVRTRLPKSRRPMSSSRPWTAPMTPQSRRAAPTSRAARSSGFPSPAQCIATLKS
jgi:ATP-binding cassette subfamily B protein